MADLAQDETREVVLVDGAGTNECLVNVDGSVNAAPVDGIKTSYSASVVGLVSVATATDIFTITGSATKTIRITRLEFSGTTTSGSGLGVNLSLIKRSTANSAGTSSASTVVPHDSSNAAATATVLSYTANPTLGTTVGAVRTERYGFVTSGGSVTPLVWNFGDRPSQSIVLRGTSQVLAINLNSTSVTGPSISVSVEWTEE